MNRLKALRSERGETQQELADHLSLTQRAISFYELGQRDIPNDVLIKLAKHFHTTTDYILGNTDSDIIQDALESENKRAIIEALDQLPPEIVAYIRSNVDFFLSTKSAPLKPLLGHDPFK